MHSIKSWFAMSAVLLFTSVLSTNVFADNRPSQPPSGGKPPSFSQMDKNGDGVLTEDEVDGPILDHFDEIDSNGDGEITEQEFSSHRPPSPPSGPQSDE